VVILGDETGLLRSFRNIPRIDVMEVGAIGVVDVIGAASIVISKEALERLGEVLG
jgi:ribosomal protein L4